LDVIAWNDNDEGYVVSINSFTLSPIDIYDWSCKIMNKLLQE
jgi:hypothetical protein